MKFFLLIVIGIFFITSAIFSMYGLLNLRELKRGENDIGICLPQKVEKFFKFTLGVSFIATTLLAIILVWQFFNG